MSLVRIHTNLTPRQLRQFAAVLPVFGGLLGLLIWHKTGLRSAALVIWIAAAAAGGVGLARPPLVRPVYLGLMYATYPIGWLVSHAILAVVFFGVITPMGVVMRVLGRDPMNRRFDRQAATYWIARRPPKDVSRYFRQY